jgi:DNA-binding transcriptional regulator YiaG
MNDKKFKNLDTKFYKFTDNRNMEFEEFRNIYESLDLKRNDAVAITGKTVNTFDKWAQENVIKDPSAAVLFRIAVLLQEEPYHFTTKDIVELFFKAAGLENPYPAELDEEEFKKQTVKRLKSIMTQLEV